MEVTKYRQQNKGALLGFFDIAIPKMGIEVRDCVLYGKGSQKWVKLPQRQFESPDGEKQYRYFVKFLNDDHARIWKEQALKCVTEYCIGAGISLDDPATAPGPEVGCENTGVPF